MISTEEQNVLIYKILYTALGQGQVWGFKIRVTVSTASCHRETCSLFTSLQPSVLLSNTPAGSAGRHWGKNSFPLESHTKRWQDCGLFYPQEAWGAQRREHSACPIAGPLNSCSFEGPLLSDKGLVSSSVSMPLNPGLFVPPKRWLFLISCANKFYWKPCCWLICVPSPLLSQ
jgi:hypothetical protein